MRAGKLRRRITIESKSATTVPDGQGGVAQVWEELHRPWAELRYADSATDFSAGGYVGDDVIIFTIRHLEGISRSMRVLYDGSYYTILGVRDKEGRARELELRCREARRGFE